MWLKSPKKTGKWTTINKIALNQDDISQYFAKYLIDVMQDQKEILYSIDVKAKGKGKQGGGLHFMVSGNKVADGYGLGKSYLVWVTEDPANSFLSSDKTFVQLYESVNDNKMSNLASYALEDDMNEGISLQVLYKDGEVTVYANGKEVFSVEGAPMKGNAIALRAMKGPIEFSNLSIKTK